MKKQQLLIITFILFVSNGLFAQCPTDAVLFDSLKIIKTITTPDKITRLENLLSLSQKCANIQDSIRGKICNSLSFNAYQKKDEQKTIKYSQLAVKYWETYASKKPNGLMYATYGTAVYHHVLLNYLDAIKYYQLTIAYTKENYWKGYCLKLISDLQLELGDYDGMLSSLDKALSFVENPTDQQLLLLASNIYNSKGIAFMMLHNEKKAIENLDLAQILYQKYFNATHTEDIELKTNILINLGLSYSNLKDLKKSENYFKTAERILVQNNMAALLPRNIYNNLGILYTDFHKYKEANTIFRKGLEGLKGQKSVELSRMYLNYAINLKAENKLDSSITALEKAIEAFPLLVLKNQNFNAIRSKRTLFYIFRDYARNLLQAYQKNHKPELLNGSLRYFSYADLVLNLMRQEHQGQESKSFWREHSRTLYESAIEACHISNNATKAFYFLEKSRAMLLLDDLKENTARQLLSATDKEKEKSFQQQILALQIQLENKPEKSVEYQQVSKKLVYMKDAFSVFKKDLEKRYPDYYAAKYNEDFKSLSDIQQWLNKNQLQAFVSYFVGDSATYAMKITNSTTLLYKLPRDKYNLTSQFINYCADESGINKNYAGFLQSANQLYTYLVAPLALPEGRIIISYDDNFLPFEALSRSSQKADFLVAHHAISYAYSANFLLKSIENRNKPFFLAGGKSFLGIAPVNFAQSLSVNNLALSGQSIQKIEQIFNGKLLIKTEATKEAFIKQFPEYRLVQLYTHADTTQQGPVFYLQNAPIRVSEINQNPAINTELIVLSACKTGLGKNIKGEGIFSLSRGFSALGIPSLITTLWSVDEKATCELTELFYQYLNEGLTKDVALQKAKQSIIERGGRYAFPTLWGSSILIGDTTPVSNSIVNGWFLLAVCAVMLITGTLAYFNYKRRRINH